MSTLFVEASALVKRYATELGSAWLTGMTDVSSGHEVVLTEITLVEVAAALSAKTRQPGGLTTAARDLALMRFLLECARDFLLMPVARSLLDRAVDLTQRHPLRAYDAVQLAGGLQANEAAIQRGLAPVIFVTADLAVLAAARAEGLAVEDPNSHP